MSYDSAGLEDVQWGVDLGLSANRYNLSHEWITTIRGALALGRDLPKPPPDGPSPFSLADPDRVQSTLVAAGFAGVELAAVDEPMVMGADAEDAFEFFGSSAIAQWLLRDLDDAGRARALDDLRSAFKQAETPEGVLLGSAAWLITASRR